jgi:hypothetical protein
MKAAPGSSSPQRRRTGGWSVRRRHAPRIYFKALASIELKSGSPETTSTWIPGF